MNIRLSDIPTFPAATNDLVEMACNGQMVSAARAWQDTTRAVLLNGKLVQPTAACAFAYMKTIQSGMPPMGLVVAEGSYEPAWSAERLAARDAAAAQKAEVFATKMASGEWPRKGVNTCDYCEGHGPGTNIYSPDADGDPTLTMFRCDECNDDEDE